MKRKNKCETDSNVNDKRLVLPVLKSPRNEQKHMHVIAKPSNNGLASRNVYNPLYNKYIRLTEDYYSKIKYLCRNQKNYY